jgi:hypothetical protein
MGRPVHYSAEVPARCQALIDMLVGRVEEDSDPQGKWGGPLKTTFLLAMATPMLVLPIERIFKPQGQNKHFVADDISLDPSLSKQVAEVFAADRQFASTPIFEAGTWTYITSCEPFDVGHDWPQGRLDELRSDAAATAAAEASARDVLLALRNALAHGGVTYLDRDGGHTQFATNMLGFASFASGGGATKLRLVRATVPGFERFLRLWAEWLSAAGVTADLRDRGPGYFMQAAE